jgi:hypothetical protein
MIDIFDFWSQIRRGENIHPADKAVFSRMEPESHGFKLECLPGCFGGRLRTAPVVLLYLSPTFKEQDAAEAQTDEMKDYYVKRWQGDEPMRSVDGVATDWVGGRIRSFGPWEEVRNQLAILNIGAYHSKEVKSYGSLLALPSSRVSLEWAQSVLFPDAEAGKRVVVCMRSASCWGLEPGRKYGTGLYAPLVTRGGHFFKNEENNRLTELIKGTCTAHKKMLGGRSCHASQ